MNTTYGVLNNSSLIIDTDKLRENVRTILRSLPAGTKLIPVVKDDAYGMGMVGVARTLSAFPEIGCFAVANVSEGVTLRREGIRQDILIMGSTLPFQYAPAIECDLTVTVSRLGMVPELAEVCKAQSKPLNVQIKLETGMHRIGVEPGKELAALIGELKAAQEWVHVTGAFSHFAWPGNAEVCEAQYKKLLAGAEQLKAAGIPVPMCHISASESSELFPQYALDAVRIGRRLYMDHPKKPLGNIQEVVSWRSYLTNVKQRHAGDSLAYFGKYVLDKDTVVATVGVGYGVSVSVGVFVGVGAGVGTFAVGITMPLSLEFASFAYATRISSALRYKRYTICPLVLHQKFSTVPSTPAVALTSAAPAAVPSGVFCGVSRYSPVPSRWASVPVTVGRSSRTSPAHAASVVSIFLLLFWM